MNGEAISKQHRDSAIRRSGCANFWVCLLPAILILGCIPNGHAVPDSNSSSTVESPSRAEQPHLAERPPLKEQRVAVAAASDLRHAMEALIAAFQKDHHEIQVSVTYGSSGQLFAQLAERAPWDVFLSADAEYPRRLAELGYVAEGTEFAYAIGHLVLWTRNDAPWDLASLGFETLRNPEMAKIAIANPKHAPYGRAAEEALRSLGLWDVVAPKLVLGNSVAQAAQFAESGAADVGILAQSLIQSPAMQARGRFLSVPAEIHPGLKQVGVVMRWAEYREASDAFCAFLRSQSGRDVLLRFGFSIPEAP